MVNLTKALHEWEEVLSYHARIHIKRRRWDWDGAFWFGWWDEVSRFLAE